MHIVNHKLLKGTLRPMHSLHTIKFYFHLVYQYSLCWLKLVFVSYIVYIISIFHLDSILYNVVYLVVILRWYEFQMLFHFGTIASIFKYFEWMVQYFVNFVHCIWWNFFVMISSRETFSYKSLFIRYSGAIKKNQFL